MPNFKSRDVITGFVVILVLIIGLVLFVNNKNRKNLIVPSPTPSISENLKNKFPNLTIPDDIDKKELSDVSGGDGMGIATQTEVLAALPDLAGNEFYQVWYVDGDKYVSLGKMRIAKGGYLYEGNLKDREVVVSREKIFDNNIEVKILE